MDRALTFRGAVLAVVLGHAVFTFLRSVFEYNFSLFARAEAFYPALAAACASLVAWRAKSDIQAALVEYQQSDASLLYGIHRALLWPWASWPRVIGWVLPSWIASRLHVPPPLPGAGEFWARLALAYVVYAAVQYPTLAGPPLVFALLYGAVTQLLCAVSHRGAKRLQRLGTAAVGTAQVATQRLDSALFRVPSAATSAVGSACGLAARPAATCFRSPARAANCLTLLLLLTTLAFGGVWTIFVVDEWKATAMSAPHGLRRAVHAVQRIPGPLLEAASAAGIHVNLTELDAAQTVDRGVMWLSEQWPNETAVLQQLWSLYRQYNSSIHSAIEAIGVDNSAAVQAGGTGGQGNATAAATAAATATTAAAAPAALPTAGLNDKAAAGSQCHAENGSSSGACTAGTGQQGPASLFDEATDADVPDPCELLAVVASWNSGTWGAVKGGASLLWDKGLGIAHPSCWPALKAIAHAKTNIASYLASFSGGEGEQGAATGAAAGADSSDRGTLATTAIKRVLGVLGLTAAQYPGLHAMVDTHLSAGLPTYIPEYVQDVLHYITVVAQFAGRAALLVVVYLRTIFTSLLSFIVFINMLLGLTFMDTHWLRQVLDFLPRTEAAQAFEAVSSFGTRVITINAQIVAYNAAFSFLLLRALGVHFVYTAVTLSVLTSFLPLVSKRSIIMWPAAAELFLRGDLLSMAMGAALLSFHNQVLRKMEEAILADHPTRVSLPTGIHQLATLGGVLAFGWSGAAVGPALALLLMACHRALSRQMQQVAGEVTEPQQEQEQAATAGSKAAGGSGKEPAPAKEATTTTTAGKHQQHHQQQRWR